MLEYFVEVVGIFVDVGILVDVGIFVVLVEYFVVVDGIFVDVGGIFVGFAVVKLGVSVYPVFPKCSFVASCNHK